MDFKRKFGLMIFSFGLDWLVQDVDDGDEYY